MDGALTAKAPRIHHYTTPSTFCQEKNRTKMKKYFSRIL
nr:MAG TPA: hypothetical protein [Caudoviricetes sp.]